MTTKKCTFVMFLALCLISIPYLYADILTVHAGNTMFKATGKKHHPVTIKVINDARAGVKTTLFWTSSTQPGNGLCHRKEFLSGDKASYTFTPKQLKGNLEIIAIVEYPEIPNKVQVGYGTIRGKKNAIIPLRNILNDGVSAYIDKDQVQEFLELPNSPDLPNNTNKELKIRNLLK